MAWLVYSPLHILWDGTTAVWIFFVLSGFVLAALAGSSGSSWLAYFPRRLLRLYLPVVGSLALAAALIVVFPRVRGGEYGSVVNDGVVTLSWSGVLHDSALVLGVSTINGVLWSLQWEVVFSLALPLYMLFATRARRYWAFKAGILLLVQVVGGATGVFAAFVLPVFGLGVLLCVERARVASIFSGQSRTKRLVVTFVATLILLNAPYWPIRIPGANVLATVGATLLVVLFLESHRLISFASGRVCQWLGRVSFSLYLTHQTLLLAVVAIFHELPVWIPIVVTLVLAFPVAEGFYLLCERPAHRLSQYVGRRLSVVSFRRVEGLQDAD